MAAYGARSGYDRDRDGTARGKEYEGRTTSVFVGNLPYDCQVQTEQRLTETFSTVGSVAGARLVFDHATGKMKGFGFVEFHDADTASSAVRNLNGSDLDGRQLRVDHAEPDNKNAPGAKAAAAAAVAAPSGSMRAGSAAVMPHKMAVPPGIQLQPGQSATDAISQTLATIPPAQLMEILSQMKGLVTQSPDKARQLLNDQPQLAYALFQAMLMMKIVDGNILMRMVANNAPTAAMPAAATVPGFASLPQNPVMAYSQQQHQPPPTAPDPYGGFRQPPPQAGPAYGAPIPGPGPAAPQVSPEYQQILNAALSLTPDQLMALPEQQRKMVVEIRTQYGIR